MKLIIDNWHVFQRGLDRGLHKLQAKQSSSSSRGDEDDKRPSRLYKEVKLILQANVNPEKLI
jgi:hypothetical protein